MNIILKPTLAVILMSAVPIIGVEANIIGAGDQEGVNVRTKWKITNNTGQSANDFHVEIFQRESGVHMNGANIGGDQVTGGVGGMSDLDRNPVNDGNNHQANFDLLINEVADGDDLLLDMNIFVNKENVLRIDDWWWTFDGVPIGGGGGGGSGGNGIDNSTCDKWGWSIGQSIKNPVSGKWEHLVSFDNSGCKDIDLNYFKLKSSMDFYGDLTSWTNDLDVIDVITSVTTLAAGTSLTYIVETDEAFAGGHIYGALSYDDPIYIWFDHPVESSNIPEPNSLLLLLIGLAGFICALPYSGKRYFGCLCRWLLKGFPDVINTNPKQHLPKTNQRRVPTGGYALSVYQGADEL